MKDMNKENVAPALRYGWGLLCVACLSLNACDKASNADTSAAPTTSASAEKVPSSDEDIDKADIPVPEDFDGEAATKITDENLDDELAKLEAEIDGDKE